ncbi:MAG: YkvA family protein [Pseudomonadales bacterium]|mgnify:CR=1 FL=1|jgi:uncharacterized membrane protein YkvA (DUF1232 family)|nr:YkvA family protein [Pseudomonadales bacterium]MDP7357471.1 YkvA family protein [Pseudomonadales bacterium]MDP7597347.1 YkvA family protein [Pseudomonadales bacterium]HJN51512.1 YkvA family protein [Pseudomonadales bacterium]
MSKQRDQKAPVGFRTAKRKAQAYLENREKAAALLRKASEKATQKKAALEGVWEDLMALFRLLKAWIGGDYQGVSWQTILLVLTAVLYFVVPLDVIPDFIAMLGFFDDAAIIAYVVHAIKEELDAFLKWEVERETKRIDSNES